MTAGRASERAVFLGLTPARWAAVGVTAGLLLLLLWFAYQRGVASGGVDSTANARARRELHVCAGEAVLRAALARHAQRVSGLASRLRG